ncbi:FKBP-type peptidyl-prolyl cis-trans isomerase [Actinomycetaceae bacterium L2_0104]
MALTGCTDSAEDLDVTVNGELGAPLTVSLTGSRVPDDLVSQTLIEGEGAEIVDGGPVLFRATSFDSRNGEIIDETGDLRLTTANSDGLGGLSGQIVGKSEGSRILIIRPGPGSGHEAAELIVVDILSTVAQGEEASVPDNPPEGMPEIGVSDDGVPEIVEGGGAIPELAVVPLIEGDGAQATEEDILVIQYVLADDKGSVLDSTWAGDGPVTVEMSELMEGLRVGITDQHVGSRVLLLIPSAKATGEGDRVAIVDILGVMDSPTESPED